jgi:hypothetical protein
MSRVTLSGGRGDGHGFALRVPVRDWVSRLGPGQCRQPGAVVADPDGGGAAGCLRPRLPGRRRGPVAMPGRSCSALSGGHATLGLVSLRLSRDAFLAITAVAWADGLLRARETKALLRAAQECGLQAEDLAAVEGAVRDGVSLDDVDLSGLSGWDRAVTYAIAYWLAKVDGVVNTEELEHLRTLRARLELPQPKLDAAASAAFDVVCLPGGHRPDKYDFQALATRLREKLPSLSTPPRRAAD